MMFYIYTRSEKIPKSFKVIERTWFSYLNFQRGIILSKMLVELQSFFSAHRLIVFYIFIKFHENISKGFRVIERTRFVTDRQTEGHKDTHRQTSMKKQSK